MWFNRNAGNPNAWTVDFDRSQPAFTDNLDRNGIARLTWQATPRNKFNLHWSEQYNTANSTRAAAPRRRRRKRRTCTLVSSRRTSSTATWSSPFTSRLLLEAGWGTLPGALSQSGAADRRHAQPADDPRAGTGRRDPEPDLADARRASAAASTII